MWLGPRYTCPSRELEILRLVGIEQEEKARESTDHPTFLVIVRVSEPRRGYHSQIIKLGHCGAPSVIEEAHHEAPW